MKQRIISGLILLSIGVFVIVNGGLPFWIFLTVSGLVAHYELQSMISKKHLFLRALLGSLVIVIAMLTTSSTLGFKMWMTPFFMVLSLLMVVMGITELMVKRLLFTQGLWLPTLRALLLISLTFPFLCLVRGGIDGFMVMLFTCIVVWTSDIVALFSGKKFGKTSLSTVSPNKTVEGSLCAIAGSLIVGFVFSFFSEVALSSYLIMAVVISVIAQMGDLHESLTKRVYKVKDSSNFIPGHGGFYDRSDSYIFVMPLLFYLINMVFN